MNFVCVDGKFFPSDEPVLYADNKAFRYGDAVFETIKMADGKIFLEDLHFERLFRSLRVLDYQLPAHFSESVLRAQIGDLALKNNCRELGRIRVTVFRGHGGLYDENRNAGYLIEAWELNASVNDLNENGLIIDVFPGGEKSCDKYSNLKSANFLLYALAAQHAKQQKLNECLVLNTKGFIADASITNVFTIRGGKVFTTSLEQGCVAGVMRKYLISSMKNAGYFLEETAISIEDLQAADEVFLTNAVQGIKWVKQFREKVYTNELTKRFYGEFVKSLFR